MASISLCSKILSTIASPAFTFAYEKGVSIWEARNELSKLKVTIETIQAVLNDAENKQEGSDAVKNWIQRLKGVLYDAEDFFDEVLTEDLFKQQMMEGKNKLSLKNKVRVSCSKLNPIASRNSIAKKVKAIRERLAGISTDMAHLGFVQCRTNDPVVSTARCFIGEKYVIGRDEDKNTILEMLISESSDTAMSDGPVVIAIDGIGGMGKTTLAHLIYNDKEVEKIFESNRWFVCVSNTSDEKEVLGKIYQSVCGGGYSDLTVFHLQEKIRASIVGKKYLLVLDDVWEDHRGRWENRKSMLSSGVKGCKIVVTTRLQSVVRAMGAGRFHNLRGLSEEDSWNLFKTLAFDSPCENDPRRENVGRKLLQRCRGVPLAIWCMGSLLHNKTFREWDEIERANLPTVGGEYNAEIMSVLKLSYEHLPSNLKQCFTYCCLFPKDYEYNKMDLVYHWIAQGYISLDQGESSFMHLLRMGFFQEVKEDGFGGVYGCKMHDIMHDLALHLVGEESIVLSATPLNVNSCARYVSLIVDGEEGGLWNISTSLLNVKLIRSCVLRSISYAHSQPNLDQICSNFKLLRTLTLSNMGIEHVPCSIGELKLVRYLDLSSNKFEELPDSMTNLVNLLVLNVDYCFNLKVWPHNFKKLIKLWTLRFSVCDKLRLMPDGIEVMNQLRYLSHFKVVKWSELDVLSRLLNQLRDHLLITFYEEMEVIDELNWQLPGDVSLQRLEILFYPGQRIQGWENNNCTSKLEYLELRNCKNVKYLPPLSCLPILKSLKLERLLELEFMEEEEVNCYNSSTSNKLFFPCLENLVLIELPKLKGWRKKVAADETPSSSSSESAFIEFCHLSKLDIKDCPNLESFPRCPKLQQFKLQYDHYNSSLIKQELSSTKVFSYTYPSLRLLEISYCWSLKKLHLELPHLQRIEIARCSELMSIELVGTPEPSLRYLCITGCEQLKSLHTEENLIAGLEEMKISNCPELRLRLSKTQAGKKLMDAHKLDLTVVDVVLVEQSLSLLSMSSLRSIEIFNCKGPMSLPGAALSSLRECQITYTDGMESLHIPSPNLRTLNLSSCEGLTSVEVEAPTHIKIDECCELKNLRITNPNTLEHLTFSFRNPVIKGSDWDWDSIPNLGECSYICEMDLSGVDGVFIERLLSSPSPSPPFKSTGSLTIAIPSLQKLTIGNVHGLKILNAKSQQLRELTVIGCSLLTNLNIVHSVALTDLSFIRCPNIGMINVDWDALTNLKHLAINPLPPPEEFPQCLLQQHALGNLRITEHSFWQF